MSNQEHHEFGGSWTQRKLEILEGYLRAYVQALKDQPFDLWYVDAFAGGGSWRAAQEDPESLPPSLFGLDSSADESRAFLDGSARIALKVHPAFDRFVFIESSEQRCKELHDLRREFGLDEARVTIVQDDANNVLSSIADARWAGRRAVVFLDPYGMQVEWTTIEAIARTRAVDLWILFPLMPANRLLIRTGDIPEAWRKKLDLLFGTPAWYEHIYERKVVKTLFDEMESVEKRPAEAVGQFYLERLKGLFPGVSDRPAVLRNSTNSPLYLLCFAAANQRGAPIALRIANDLLKEMG